MHVEPDLRFRVYGLRLFIVLRIGIGPATAKELRSKVISQGPVYSEPDWRGGGGGGGYNQNPLLIDFKSIHYLAIYINRF